MTMKLNDKGANRIDLETMEYDPRDHEFELDDFVGAVVFSVIGYFYVKSRGKNSFAKNFIPVPKYRE